MWCYVFFWDSTIFCNNFARWLQKIVAACDAMVVMCWFFWDALIFCKIFARWLQKIVATRPRNPRFKDVHTGTKRRLDVKTSNRDSGILGSGSNMRCDVLVLLGTKIWKTEPTFRYLFSKYFSNGWILDCGDALWKIVRKVVPTILVRSSKSSFGEHKLRRPLSKSCSQIP